uniref:Sugar phosphate transporter domain-containing protein n=1 Tax=Tetraselmis chuii TaxID=63592 RepID=A0A7S1SSC3_9CHLO
MVADGQVTPLQQVMACVMYGSVSISITLFNKAIFAVYKFQYPNVVTLLQILISIVYIKILGVTGHMKLAPFSWKTVQLLLPMTFFWWIYVFSGVTALNYLNVPMFSVLRRSTSLVVVGINYVLYRTFPSMNSLSALLVMAAGAIVAGMSDMTYNSVGYFWTFVCIFSTAAYLTAIKWSKERSGVGEHDLLMYNNLIALPFMATYLYFGTSELDTVWEYPRLHDPGFQLFLLLSISQAFLLNVCIFYCTTVNSPLATTVTGQLKDLLMTSLGMVLFGDVIYNPVNIMGLCVGLGGGMWYSYIGYRKSVEASSAKSKDSDV